MSFGDSTFGSSPDPAPALSLVRVTPGSEDEQRPIGDGTLAQQAEKTRAMAERTAVHRATAARRQLRAVTSTQAPAAHRAAPRPLPAVDWAFLTSEQYRGDWGHL